jgi:beta-glucanase (GH16 family)
MRVGRFLSPDSVAPNRAVGGRCRPLVSRSGGWGERTAITALVVSVVLQVMFGVATHAQEPATAPTRDGWKLAWADEFDGETLNPLHWDFDLGDGFYNYESNQWIAGWGNNELQTYTDRQANVSVVDGRLVITALKESYQGRGYTSGRLKSRGRSGQPLVNQRYGRIEIRAKLPVGQGIWPALWMLPQDESYGTWAASGEIDILEAKGQEPRKIHGTIHYGGRWPVNTSTTATHELAAGDSIANDHVYAIEWEPGEIRWYCDEVLYSTKRFWWSGSAVDGGQGRKPTTEADLNRWPAPFDQPFYFVLNIAVGGNFAGAPDPATRFPAAMEIDYVRVYEPIAGYPTAPKPRGEGQLPFE